MVYACVCGVGGGQTAWVLGPGDRCTPLQDGQQDYAKEHAWRWAIGLAHDDTRARVGVGSGGTWCFRVEDVDSLLLQVV